MTNAEKLQNVKDEVFNLLGKDLYLTVNKGRKKL